MKRIYEACVVGGFQGSPGRVARDSFTNEILNGWIEFDDYLAHYKNGYLHCDDALGSEFKPAKIEKKAMWGDEYWIEGYEMSKEKAMSLWEKKQLEENVNNIESKKQKMKL